MNCVISVPLSKWNCRNNDGFPICYWLNNHIYSKSQHSPSMEASDLNLRFCKSLLPVQKIIPISLRMIPFLDSSTNMSSVLCLDQLEISLTERDMGPAPNTNIGCLLVTSHQYINWFSSCWQKLYIRWPTEWQGMENYICLVRSQATSPSWAQVSKVQGQPV